MLPPSLVVVAHSVPCAAPAGHTAVVNDLFLQCAIHPLAYALACSIPHPNTHTRTLTHTCTRTFTGAKYLSDEEQTQVGDLNWRQSHATHDLYHAIEAGDYPEWELSVQVGWHLVCYVV